MPYHAMGTLPEEEWEPNKTKTTGFVSVVRL